MSAEHFGCVSSSVSVFWTASVTEQHSCNCFKPKGEWLRCGRVKKGVLPGFISSLTTIELKIQDKKKSPCCPGAEQVLCNRAGGTKGRRSAEGREERIHELTPPASIHADEAGIQCQRAGGADYGLSRPTINRLKQSGVKERRRKSRKNTNKTRQAEGESVSVFASLSSRDELGLRCRAFPAFPPSFPPSSSSLDPVLLSSKPRGSLKAAIAEVFTYKVNHLKPFRLWYSAVWLQRVSDHTSG